MYSVLLFLFFMIGASIGSFLNVVIYRLPRGQSPVHPRSKCPSCGDSIPWYLNLPVMSYVFLKGQCRKCRFKIPISYLAIEILMGLVSLALLPDFSRVESLYGYFFYMSIFSIFVAHFVIDLQFKILPDALNIYLAFILGTFSIVFNSVWFWAIGAAIGFGFPYLITWLFYKYSGKVGLGGGDIKLYGALGLYLGPVGVMTNIFMSCFLGSVVTLLLIALKLFKREDFIPFGPFILIVAFFQIFLPEQFSWLLSILGFQVY